MACTCHSVLDWHPSSSHTVYSFISQSPNWYIIVFTFYTSRYEISIFFSFSLSFYSIYLVYSLLVIYSPFHLCIRNNAQKYCCSFSTNNALLFMIGNDINELFYNVSNIIFRNDVQLSQNTRLYIRISKVSIIFFVL